LIAPVFAAIQGEKESGLTTEEKSALFTTEGYYRAPRALPGEVRENLSRWQLPYYEKQRTEGKMLSTSYSDGTITLQNGWNLISIPKNLSSGYDTVAVVFAGINTGGHSIFHYNGRTQYWDALQSSTVLKPLEGYYVSSVGAFTLDTYYVGAGQQQNP